MLSKPIFSLLNNSSAKGEASIEINQPPKQVFQFVAVDFLWNYPRWTPEIESVDSISDGPMQVGYQIRQHRTDADREKETILTVTDLQPLTSFSYQGQPEPHKCDYLFNETTVNSTTKLTFRFRLDDVEIVIRPFIKLIRSAVQERVDQTVGNIKKLIEDEL